MRKFCQTTINSTIGAALVTQHLVDHVPGGFLERRPAVVTGPDVALSQRVQCIAKEVVSERVGGEIGPGDFVTRLAAVFQVESPLNFCAAQPDAIGASRSRIGAA